VPAAPEGGIVVRQHYLSLDPYMRGRLDDVKSYAPPQPLNEVMIGGSVGEVVESKSPDYAVGDAVVGMGGWQLYAAGTAAQWRKVDRRLPLSVYLGAVGMPGVTAWVGLTDIGEPKPGETVVVSSAAGAVGSVVGQLAKLRGGRAVGIAGGAEKCRYVTDELGFDACIDYKAGDVYGQLEAATPGGIDVYFENVGGELFDMVLRRLNAFARIPLCGWISSYDTGAQYAVKNMPAFLVSRAKLQGFIVSEHMERWGPALKELGEHVAAGRIRYRETIAEGLDSAPRAFIGMLHGANLGKQLVKLS
jgi:NADPH-dependent curcumin reductase CurA